MLCLLYSGDIRLSGALFSKISPCKFLSDLYVFWKKHFPGGRYFYSLVEGGPRLGSGGPQKMLSPLYFGDIRLSEAGQAAKGDPIFLRGHIAACCIAAVSAGQSVESGFQRGA